MNKRKYLTYLIGILFIMTINIYSQSENQQAGMQLVNEDKTWLLPNECYVDNICEVRISHHDTIAAWDKMNHLLYVSPANASAYDVYDLSTHAQFLINVDDFVLFENVDYVVFYSGIGASNAISRFNLTDSSFDILLLPFDQNLSICNRQTALSQLLSRYIYPIGLDNNLLVCTAALEGKLLINIVDVASFSITDTIDINGRLGAPNYPIWTLGAGATNKLYILNHPIENVITNPPQISETEEFVLIYDLSTTSWSYQVKPRETTEEILDVLSADGSIFFMNYSGRPLEMLQFSSDFQLMRRIPSEAEDRSFLGMFSDGSFLMSINNNLNISVEIRFLEDYPLLVEP